MNNIFGIGSKVSAIGVAALFLSAAALSQVSFNIDLDDEFAPPPLGGGAPSSSFGAAAGDQGKGVWNKIDAAGQEPTELLDLQGNLSGVVLSGPTWGVRGGHNFPGQENNRRLMNDGRSIASSDVWTFAGVPLGSYAVRTYAVIPSFENSFNPTAVSVTGAGTKFVTGPMIVDEFVEGQTHVTHYIRVDNGTFSIRVDRGQFYAGFVNGFQITAIVPEPATFVGVFLGFLFLSSRKGKRRS